MNEFLVLLFISLLLSTTAVKLAQRKQNDNYIQDLPPIQQSHVPLGYQLDINEDLVSHEVSKRSEWPEWLIRTFQLLSGSSHKRKDSIVKRIVMNAIGSHKNIATSRMLLEWLKSNDLFANYDKRLSAILNGVKYSGHQAWFSGYGKRSVVIDKYPQQGISLDKIQPELSSSSMLNHIKSNINITQPEILAMEKNTVRVSKGIPDADRGRSIVSKLIKRGISDMKCLINADDKFVKSGTQDKAWFSIHGKQNDNGFNGHQAWFSGYGKRNNNKLKRHQAWFSGYGKRNDKLKRQQAWFSGYGKDIENRSKRHQAWFSGYGKRNENSLKNHQAWYSGYGNRKDNGQKSRKAWLFGKGKRNGIGLRDHQAWFSGYGKRTDNGFNTYKA